MGEDERLRLSGSAQLHLIDALLSQAAYGWLSEAHRRHQRFGYGYLAVAQTNDWNLHE